MISVITPGRQPAVTAFRRYYLLKNKLSDRMIKQLLNSVIAKYRDLSVSRRSIICLSLRLRQIIDLLATDKSRYFAQPRPIIANYLSFYFYKRYVYLDCCVKLSFSLLIPTFQCLYRTGCNIVIILFQFSFVNYSKSSRSKLIHQCDFLVWNFLPVCLRWHK